MRDWKATLRNVLTNARGLPGRLRPHLTRFLRGTDPLTIVPYLGHGTSDRLLLTGRVLEDEGIAPATDADTALHNLLNFYRRLETDEVPGARVRATFQGAVTEAVTDGEGFFALEITPPTPLDPAVLWHDVELELLEPAPSTGQPVRATGRVLVPPPTARFGVISDVDDTVVQSHVRDKLKMILTVTTLNARTRLPFEGVAAFYQALQRGATGAEHNPVFYVSGSPWNLYDLLQTFFEVHGLPPGPLFLKDLSARVLLRPGQHHAHKLSKIEPILRLYPNLPFVLIGDSGEQDPEIYREVVRNYPDRIKVIYIRSVNPDPARVAAVDALAAEVLPTGCQLLPVPDSAFAATHAAGEGLIAPPALPAVRAEKAQDEQAPPAPAVADAVAG